MNSFKGIELPYDEYKKGISGYDFIGLDFEVEDITDEGTSRLKRKSVS